MGSHFEPNLHQRQGVPPFTFNLSSNYHDPTEKTNTHNRLGRGYTCMMAHIWINWTQKMTIAAMFMRLNPLGLPLVICHSGNPFQASAISHFQDLTICIHDCVEL